MIVTTKLSEPELLDDDAVRIVATRSDGTTSTYETLIMSQKEALVAVKVAESRLGNCVDAC